MRFIFNIISKLFSFVAEYLRNQGREEQKRIEEYEKVYKPAEARDKEQGEKSKTVDSQIQKSEEKIDELVKNADEAAKRIDERNARTNSVDNTDSLYSDDW